MRNALKSKPKNPPKRSTLEQKMEAQLSSGGIPPHEQEYKFHPVRKWRFDIAWPDQKIGVECEGGMWIQGRHNRGAGMEGDMEKYNAATLAGWQVYRFSGGMISRGEAIETIRLAFGRVVS